MITTASSARGTFSPAARLLFLFSVVVLSLAWDVARASDFATELQFGGVAEWSLLSGASQFGPNVSLEQELIQHQLQIELGVSRFQHSRSTEWEFDLAFKKPFDLGRGVELTVGLGPTWTRSTGTSGQGNAVGGEFSLDFQFWITERWGWFVEPSYEFGAIHNNERTLALTLGFVVGF